MKKLFSTRYSDSAFNTALFILRVGAGSIMMIKHGLDKLQHFSQYSTQFMDLFGIGKPATTALVVFAEFFCSAFVVLGLFTRLACIPLIITMGVALFMAHKGQMFGDGEGATTYLLIFTTILLLGPGKASVDRMIGK